MVNQSDAPAPSEIDKAHARALDLAARILKSEKSVSASDTTSILASPFSAEVAKATTSEDTDALSTSAPDQQGPGRPLVTPLPLAALTTAESD